MIIINQIQDCFCKFKEGRALRINKSGRGTAHGPLVTFLRYFNFNFWCEGSFEIISKFTCTFFRKHFHWN